MSCYTGPEKCCRAIWCELFVVQGYIPYLKKWSKQSTKPVVDQGSQEEDAIHSDIQRLAPGGFLKMSGKLPEVAKSMTKNGPLR